jgi:hypothetical protein
MPVLRWPEAAAGQRDRELTVPVPQVSFEQVLRNAERRSGSRARLKPSSFRIVLIRGRVFGLVDELEGRDLGVVPFGHQLAAYLAIGIVLIAGGPVLDPDLVHGATMRAGMSSTGAGLPCLDHPRSMAQTVL